MRLKVISFAIAFLLFWQVGGVVVFADDNESGMHSQAISRLTMLKIIENYPDGKFHPDDTITRAEFCAILYKASISDGVFPNETVFYDVPLTHWANKYINAMQAMGVVSGYSDGYFRPEEEVSFQQAIKMVVSLLGYSVKAEAKGGYYLGYVLTASEIGLVKGINSQVFRRAEAAQLIYNALDINMMERSGFGNNAEYSIGGGGTLLSRIKVEKRYGVVDYNGISSLYDNRAVNREMVSVSRVDYNTKLNLTNMIGCAVEFYVNTGSEPEEIIGLFEDIERNSITKVADKDVLNANLKEVEWDKDGKKSDMQADENLKVVVNGVYISNPNDSDIMPVSGYAELIDNDRDDKYEVIRVCKAYHYGIERINANDNAIYFKNNAVYSGRHYIKLEDNSSNYFTVLFKDEKEIKLKEISINDIITIKSGSNSNVIYNEIWVESRNVRGTVYEVDSGDGYLIIRGQRYDFSDDYITATKNSSVTKAIMPKAGDSGTFFLNINGEITAADMSLGKGNYGYYVAYGKSNGVDPKYQIKLFDINNGIEIYDVAENLKVNGESVAFSNIQMGKLVLYKLNAEKQIISIQTAGYNDDLEISAPRQSRKFIGFSGKFGNDIIIGSKTQVMRVFPSGEDDTEKYSIIGSDYFEDQKPYDIEAYNSEFGIPQFILVYEQTQTNAIASNTFACIVKKLTTSINEDGEIVQKLTCLIKGQPGVYSTSKARVIPECTTGAVVRFNLDSAGMINKAEKLFDPSQPRDWSRTGGDSYFETVYGRMYDFGAEAVVVETKSADVAQRVTYPIKSAYIYIYDSKSQEVRTGTIFDANSFKDAAENASNVFLRVYSGLVRDILIIK